MKNNLKLIKSLKHAEGFRVTSVCKLKDKRIAICFSNKMMKVFNYPNKGQIIVPHVHEGDFHAYTLRNGDVATSSFEIKIWRIGENDYQLIRTFGKVTWWIGKLIELEDGRVCSLAKQIRIWDNNTCQSIANIIPNTDLFLSIIELNNYIISVSNFKVRKFSTITYECIQTIQGIRCCCCTSLEKLNNNTLLVGTYNLIFVVDMKSSKIKKLEDDRIECVVVFCVIRNDLVLFGSSKGEICEYNPLSNRIMSKYKFHRETVMCLIHLRNNRIVSTSDDRTNVYEYDCLNEQ